MSVTMANICVFFFPFFFFFFFFLTSNSAQFIDAPRYLRETFDYLSSFALNLWTIFVCTVFHPFKILLDESFKEREHHAEIIIFAKIYHRCQLWIYHRIVLSMADDPFIGLKISFDVSLPIQSLISDAPLKRLLSTLFIKFLASLIRNTVASILSSRIMIFVYL